MSKLKFKAEGFDFMKVWDCFRKSKPGDEARRIGTKEMTRQAQAIYDEHVSKLPKVYSSRIKGSTRTPMWSRGWVIGDNISARLDCIEEIEG